MADVPVPTIATADSAPDDTFLGIQATGGPRLRRFPIAHTSTYAPGQAAAYLKTLSQLANGDEVSIDQFLKTDEIAAIRAGTSIYNASADWQDAFDAAALYGGIQLVVPPGLYNLPDQTQTAGDNTHLRGVGRPRLLLAAGQVAGFIPFLVKHSGFSARGLKLEGATKSHCFYVQPPSAAPLTGFRFEDLEGSGLFYMARGDGAADRLLYDFVVRGCKNVAPLGTNCGHFMVDFGVGVQYIGNTIQNGNTTSGYGVADSKNIVIAGNIERGMEDTGGATEAACQIEDSDASNAVISGNSFEHDIWVAGSNDVTVSGNSCRRMRVSVGNVDGFNVHSVLFAGNRAAQIHAALFGGGAPAERIKARFESNVLDPAGRTVNGVAISSLVYAEGTYVNELELHDNIAVTDPSTNGLVLSRSATSEYHLYNNDFGTLAHSITGGSVGGLYERGNRNKAIKTGNGYIEAALTSTFAISAGAWQTTVLNTEVVDVNAEHSGGVFTIRKSGTYRFSGIMTVDPDAAGSQVGFRIFRSSGTPAEVARMAFLRAADANSMGVPLRSVDLYLTAGDVVQLEHFFTGATTQFVVGSGNVICNFQVSRLD